MSILILPKNRKIILYFHIQNQWIVSFFKIESILYCPMDES